MQIQLSLIIPVYNTSEFLNRCFTSIFKNETSFRYEVIAIDDGSSDDSLVKLNKIKESAPGNCEFNIIHLEENKGVQNARFVGLDGAKGKYVFFIDSDDEIGSDCLEEIFSKMEKDNLDILYNNILLVDDKTMYSLFSKQDFSRVEEYGPHLESLLFGAFGFIPSRTVKKSVLDKVEIMSLPKLALMEDLNYLIEISRYLSANYGVLDKNIYTYYQKRSWHVEKMNLKKAEDSLYVINKRYSEIKKDYPEHFELFKSANLTTCLRLIHAVKKSKNFNSKERKELIKKIKKDEAISCCIKISFKQFIKLPLKDKIRFILYK